MVEVIADQSVDDNSRFLACTIFKNTILNSTKVSLFHLQEPEMESLWVNLRDDLNEGVKYSLLQTLIDPS